MGQIIKITCVCLSVWL